MRTHALLAVAILAALGAAAAALPRTLDGSGKKSGGTDQTPPRVHALRSSGERGTNVRLLYRVTDESGRSSEQVSVRSGSRVLTESGWAPFGPATGKLYYFEFPAPASM